MSRRRYPAERHQIHGARLGRGRHSHHGHTGRSGGRAHVERSPGARSDARVSRKPRGTGDPMKAIDSLRDCYTHRTAAAHAWKAQGGKIIGCFEDNVPAELCMAAGFLPYRLSGNPRIPPDTLRQYLFPLWKKHSLADRQVKLGFVISMIDLIFRGE